MSSQIISVDLMNKDSWIVDDVTNQEIAPNYQQKRREPKVGWTINTMPTPEGIKSASLFFRDSNFTANNAVPLGIKYTLDNLLDTLGNLTYSITTPLAAIDPQVGDGFTFFVYYNDFKALIASRSAGLGEVTLELGTTVFQNRNLYVFDSAVSFSNVTEAGDVTNAGVFELTLTASEIILTKYALTGLGVDFTAQYGFTSSGNYLLFWTLDTIVWSDPNVFTEFTVGGSSLAGSQKITEAKGTIITVVPFPNGFMIYCTANIISAQYSGDAANPWIFTELVNSSSLIVADGVPLVTYEETTSKQFAYTSEGLIQLTSESSQVLSNKINQFLGTSYVETKDIGANTIVHKLLTPLDTSQNKVKKLELKGEMLFIFTGAPEDEAGAEFTDHRLYVFNLMSGKLVVLEGRFLSVTEELNVIDITDINILKNRSYPRSGSYILTRDVQTVDATTYNSRFLVLDFTTRTENTLVDFGSTPPLREAEVVIGELSLNADRNTEVISVKLFGETMYTGADGQTPDETTRAKVFAYSSILGMDNPVEFIYYESVGKYLGFITGDDIEVEVRGSNFYLTDIEFEIQDGGRVGA